MFRSPSSLNTCLRANICEECHAMRRDRSNDSLVALRYENGTCLSSFSVCSTRSSRPQKSQPSNGDWTIKGLPCLCSMYTQSLFFALESCLVCHSGVPFLDHKSILEPLRFTLLLLIQEDRTFRSTMIANAEKPITYCVLRMKMMLDFPTQSPLHGVLGSFQ